jgi:predicted nucleotidyltransferase
MNNDFQKNIEKLIIRSGVKDSSFELLNPLYKRLSDDNNTEFVEIYTNIS